MEGGGDKAVESIFLGARDKSYTQSIIHKHDTASELFIWWVI